MGTTWSGITSGLVPQGGAMQKVVIASWAMLLWGTTAWAESPARWMLELTLEGRKIEGAPLTWSADTVRLLGRDGRLWQFAPSQAADFRKTSDRFESYSISQLRAVLLRELGEGVEVSGTGHYLVAHPRGQRDRWAQRFEDLYRSLAHYFLVRGFRLQEPAFPLIGIVGRDHQEFLHYSAENGGPRSSGVLGYYSLLSNRIALYDTAAGAASPGDWRRNASVVIHEATHQTAFNCGVHNRYAPPPVWVAEGLATMFETPGVYDSYHFPERADRINRERLRHFRQLAAPRHQPGLLSQMVASDRLFQASPALAYAEAWALTFYLAETQARRWADYLARTADRPTFEPYTAAQRTADFTEAFGGDWRMLEARFLRFVKELE